MSEIIPRPEFRRGPSGPVPHFVLPEVPGHLTNQGEYNTTPTDSGDLWFTTAHKLNVMLTVDEQAAIVTIRCADCGERLGVVADVGEARVLAHLDPHGAVLAMEWLRLGGTNVLQKRPTARKASQRLDRLPCPRGHGERSTAALRRRYTRQPDLARTSVVLNKLS